MKKLADYFGIDGMLHIIVCILIVSICNIFAPLWIAVIAAAFLSSADRPKQAFAVSILRGFVLIIPIAWGLSVLFGLTGVWMAVPVTEACVCLLALIFLFKKDRGSLS